MDDSPKNRYEDLNPNRRTDGGCLFKCEDHGEWRERLKILDHIPNLLTWMNSVKKSIEDLPDLVHWVDKEKGSRKTAGIIISAIAISFIGFMISFVVMFKSDMTTNLNAFKLESNERINIFKAEMSERQAALKLEMSERQRIYEQNAKDQNTTDTSRINTIVDAIAEMKTQTGIMFKLNEQFQKQATIDRDENKAMIKDLQTMVLEHQNETRLTAKKK